MPNLAIRRRRRNHGHLPGAPRIAKFGNPAAGRENLVRQLQCYYVPEPAGKDAPWRPSPRAPRLQTPGSFGCRGVC